MVWFLLAVPDYNYFTRQHSLYLLFINFAETSTQRRSISVYLAKWLFMASLRRFPIDVLSRTDYSSLKLKSSKMKLEQDIMSYFKGNLWNILKIYTSHVKILS